MRRAGLAALALAAPAAETWRGLVVAPERRDHPAYRFMRDGDGDGVVCE